MDSLFSREIEQLVHAFGESALRPIESAVAVPHTSQEVLAEALITLGRLIDPVTHQGRLRLLLRQLRSESAWVRDGALQGLSWMEDASAVAGLRRAAKVESIRELRANIEVVISELGEVDECLWS